MFASNIETISPPEVVELDKELDLAELSIEMLAVVAGGEGIVVM